MLFKIQCGDLDLDIMGVGKQMVLTRQNMQVFTNIEREIKRISRKLDYYSKNPVKSTHGVVKGSMECFPYAERHFEVSGADVKSDEERNKKIRQLCVTLEQRRKEYEDFELDVELAIENITDMEMRQIIEMKFIEKWTDEQISREIGYERSSITKKISNFFEEQEHSHNSH